uniref:Uncharacterized protein n=1 Tax=Oryza punctata TaxID=4537 RepID=A0A0E0KMP9_ORYPU
MQKSFDSLTTTRSISSGLRVVVTNVRWVLGGVEELRDSGSPRYGNAAVADPVMATSGQQRDPAEFICAQPDIKAQPTQDGKNSVVGSMQ